jgi:hypothetical protein
VRHFEALHAAQARQLADTVRGNDGRMISRVRSRVQAGLVAVGGTLGGVERKGCVNCAHTTARELATIPLIIAEPCNHGKLYSTGFGSGSCS